MVKHVFGMLKTIDSLAVLKAIEANPVSRTQIVSGEFGISLSSVVRQFEDLG